MKNKEETLPSSRYLKSNDKFTNENVLKSYLPFEIDPDSYGFITADGSTYDNCGHYGKKDLELTEIQKFIVLAVNSHGALLKIANYYLNLLKSDHIGIGGKDLTGGQIKRTEDIIKQAEGK